jgi:hypothetical protein
MPDMYGTGITLPKSILDAQERVEHATPAPVQVERTVSPVDGKKVWETPILDRGKLRDHLNTLAQHDFEIFTILPLDRTTVQIVCFKVIPETSTEE